MLSTNWKVKGVKRIANNRRGYTNHGKPPVTIQRIKELQAQGYNITEIARETGISRQAIYQKLNADTKQKALDVMGTDKHIATIKMGDDNVGEFVKYHVELMSMGQRINKKDPGELYDAFVRYLEYCAEHNIVPTNGSAYLATGCTKQEMSAWRQGKKGTPEHQKFAELVSAFFSSIHEQGAAEGMLNPILAIFWQKAHDGLSDQPKIEVEVNNPLGDKKSAQEIAAEYSEVELPD